MNRRSFLLALTVAPAMAAIPAITAPHHEEQWRKVGDAVTGYVGEVPSPSMKLGARAELVYAQWCHRFRERGILTKRTRAVIEVYAHAEDAVFQQTLDGRVSSNAITFWKDSLRDLAEIAA